MEDKIRYYCWCYGPPIVAGVIVLVILLFVGIKPKAVMNESEPTLSEAIEENDIGELKIFAQDIGSNEYITSDKYSEMDYALYESGIIGSYVVLNKYVFDFREKGVYYGFFDSENEYLSNLRYEIRNVDGEKMLFVIDKRNDRYVSYKLLMSGGIVSLAYNGSILFELK